MLVAVAHVESQMTASARSSAGARGLLQVLPSTAVAEAGGAPTQRTLSYVADVTSSWRELLHVCR
jgi:soluble lytic murein transglycosylase-like protein